MKKITFLLLIFFSIKNIVHGQTSPTVLQYINTYKDIAIAEMQRTGVPASITLAQGIHETEAGQSELVRASNNHFGIKCKGDWKGETVYHDDDARGECFRKYADPADSYKDHSDFLKNRPNYSFLFSIDPADYEAWAWGLKKAGYATNPKYPQILIKLIRDYNLQDYTLIALNSKTAGPPDDVSSLNKKGREGAETAKDMEIERIKKAYPQGIFRINETRVTFIAKGTSYLRIADENEVPLSKLFEFNDMDAAADIATDDQLVYLQRKRKKGATAFHVVLNGETLFSIAQSEGIRMESLLEYNLLRKGMQPQAGEKLYLLDKAPTMPRLYSGSYSNALNHTENVTRGNQVKEGPSSMSNKKIINATD